MIHGDGKGGMVRGFPRQYLETNGRPTRQEAGQGGERGGWNFTTFNHSEGAILLVQLSTSKAGKPWCDGAVVLRLREEAPLIQVVGHTIVAADNLQPHVNVFQGRADVLTAREANLLGAGLTLQYIQSYMNKDELKEAFDIREIASGITSKPKIRRAIIGGEKKIVIEASRKKRNIRLRKNSG